MKKTTNETNMKKELLNSLREKYEDEETQINTVNNPTKAIEIINHYEEIILNHYEDSAETCHTAYL